MVLRSIYTVSTQYLHSIYTVSTHLTPGMMTNQAGSTARIELDHSLSFKIRVIDPKLEFLCANPDTIPNTKIVLGPNKGYVILYLKVIYLQFSENS